MSMRISSEEFLLMQNYIKELCGINIAKDQAYLIENRLAKLLADTGAKSILDFYKTFCEHKKSNDISEKVIDAITTNETYWFRDRTVWQILEEVLLPVYIKEISEGKRSGVKIWSAACSTGQEPYSIAMCIDKYLDRQGIK
ncbi:CheR family methyltransferase, partial [Pelotomaculum sp. PtaB.Bin117]|uniref:CheR family methyltransferase n=1 Tax=Pelotomaculum sp. PtaB.Bin117 TaxID=1811694 RepID=UPI00257FCFE1